MQRLLRTVVQYHNLQKKLLALQMLREVRPA